MLILEKDSIALFNESYQFYPLRHGFPFTYLIEDEKTRDNWVFAYDFYISSEGVEAVKPELMKRDEVKHAKLFGAGYWLKEATRKKTKSKKMMPEYSAIFRCFVGLNASMVSEKYLNAMLKNIAAEVERIDDACNSMANKDWNKHVLGDKNFDGEDMAHYLTLEAALSSITNMVLQSDFSANGYEPITGKQFCNRKMRFRYSNLHGLPLKEDELVRTASFAGHHHIKAQLIEKRLKFHFSNGTTKYYSSFEIEVKPELVAMYLQQAALNLGFVIMNMQKCYTDWIQPLQVNYMDMEAEADREYQQLAAENIEQIDDIRRSEVAALNPQFAMGMVRPSTDH